MEADRRPYYFERSLVTPEALWDVSHEQVVSLARLQLPAMEKSVFQWIGVRASITDQLTITLRALPNQPPLDDLHSTERLFVAAARREAAEFVRAVLFSDVPVEEKQGELGDVLFFLLTLTANYDLTDSPDDWLVRNRFDTGNDRLPEELNSTPGELVVQSAVELLDNMLGFGSSAMVFHQEAVDQALARAYAVIFRYSTAAEWDLVEIMRRTQEKNDYNYPDIFFNNAHRPFLYLLDAIDCLRLFRSAKTNDGRSYLDLLHERFGTQISWVHRTCEPRDLHAFVTSALEKIRTSSPVLPHQRLAYALLSYCLQREHATREKNIVG